jgi:hypothetical protein
MKHLHRRRLWWIAPFAILLVALAVAFVPVRPFGKFTCNDVSWIGVAYWEFADGHCYLTTCDNRTSEPDRLDCGTVHKDSDGWFVAGHGGVTSRVETTLLTFRMSTAPPSRVFWRHVGSPRSWKTDTVK